MARKTKTVSGAVGRGGVNPAPVPDNQTVRVAAEQLTMMPIEDLVPYANNARVHDKRQIAQLRASLREFGFVTPVLIDFDNNIIAGHGRVEAARAEGMTEVPCVLVSSLTEAQRKAYVLADNRLSETGAWDPKLLKIEMEGLEALHFDTGVIGFDAAELKKIHVGEYTRAAPGRGGDGGAGQLLEETGGEETPEYSEFVEKFKPKLTTDDCYTPENIYACVKAWAVKRYDLGDAEIVRPFFPGGDYERYDYPDGCVVIDNPPFSILSQICRFYTERSIPYFLFAPTLTLFSIHSGGCNYLPVGVTVTYENGAGVSTSFVTSLGGYKIETAPELYQLIQAENLKNLREGKAELPNYQYPTCIVSAAMYKLSKYGQTLRIRAEDTVFIRAMDAQQEQGKAIYGSGFLLSEQAAAEKAAAERAAEEAAEEAVKRAAAEKAAAIRWELSARETALVKMLSAGGLNAEQIQ